MFSHINRVLNHKIITRALITHLILLVFQALAIEMTKSAQGRFCNHSGLVKKQLAMERSQRAHLGVVGMGAIGWRDIGAACLAARLPKHVPKWRPRFIVHHYPCSPNTMAARERGGGNTCTRPPVHASRPPVLRFPGTRRSQLAAGVKEVRLLNLEASGTVQVVRPLAWHTCNRGGGKDHQ